MSDQLNTLGRPVRAVSKQPALFDIEPDWREQWWGMPSFDLADARPSHRITINFMTAEDVKEFAQRTGIPVTIRSDSCWFPHQEPLRGDFFYDGPKTDSRYPICIPSKGRADCQRTGKILDRMGVSYRFFVEETEYEEYCRHIGESRVVKMPFHDLGQGSIPARNFIWEWAIENGHKRHWVVDDNIVAFSRCTANRRLQTYGGGYFCAMEDFADRYENLHLCGPHDQSFVSDRDPNTSAYLLNTRIYSCILIDSECRMFWRGRYNEDTDLSLRVLKSGACTAAFKALCIDKPDTSGAKGSRAMKGGNTDNVYNTGDHRRAFAESLREQHPDVVKVVWKFNRWHHEVDYGPFKKNRLILKPGVVPTKAVNEYGMRLVRRMDAERDLAEI